MATYTGPTPGSGQYGLLQAQADAAYQEALGATQQQRSQFLQGQGLAGEYGADGSYTGFHIQANDPFGAYQQMESGNAQQGAADDAAIGAVGFKGGLATQMHEAAQKGYSANAANWAMNNLNQLGAFAQQDVQSTKTHGDTLYSDLLNSIQTAIANGTYNPADYTGITIPGYGTITPGTLPPATSDSGSTGSAGDTFTPPPPRRGGKRRRRR